MINEKLYLARAREKFLSDSENKYRTQKREESVKKYREMVRRNIYEQNIRTNDRL